jgi:hypothetical protein
MQISYFIYCYKKLIDKGILLVGECGKLNLKKYYQPIFNTVFVSQKTIYICIVNTKKIRMFSYYNHERTKYLKYIALILIQLFVYTGVYATQVDNITKLIFFKNNGIPYAIFQESLFHPTSQTYSKGNTIASGFTESRISVYNLNTGKLSAQKEMGRIDSAEASIVLGLTPSNLWIYSLKYKSGLQSLNPLTLERNISQATIYSKLKDNIGRFIEPDWQQIKKDYGFSCIQQKLIVTNDKNEHFYIDVEQFTSEKITEPLEFNPLYKDNLNSTAYINDSIWKLEGYDNMQLVLNNTTFNNFSFLYGNFILEQNPKHLFDYYANEQEQLSTQIQQLQSEPILSVKQQTEKDLLNQKMNASKRNISALINGKKPSDKLMQPNNHSFFIFSKADENDASVIKISKIELSESNKVSVAWERTISGMFYNVSSARNTRAFKYFFGDFAPNFDFRHFELIDNKLIVIYLMQVCCINIETGAIEWSFVLK